MASRIAQLFIIGFLLFAMACNGPNNTESSTNIADTAAAKTAGIQRDSSLTKTTNSVPEKYDSAKGDFNGDGKQETAWLVPPEILENDSCPGGCNSLIKFSDVSIPPITVERCISGHPDNLGDLNKNGTDELGISTEWFQGCWNSYNSYTLKNGKWIYAVEPFSTHCIQWEEGVVPIEIDKKKPGHVLIHYSQSTDEAIVVKTKSEPVK